jgi:hypothetical protein
LRSIAGFVERPSGEPVKWAKKCRPQRWCRNASPRICHRAPLLCGLPLRIAPHSGLAGATPGVWLDREGLCVFRSEWSGGDGDEGLLAWRPSIGARDVVTRGVLGRVGAPTDDHFVCARAGGKESEMLQGALQWDHLTLCDGTRAYDRAATAAEPTVSQIIRTFAAL